MSLIKKLIYKKTCLTHLKRFASELFTLFYNHIKMSNNIKNATHIKHFLQNCIILSQMSKNMYYKNVQRHLKYKIL